MNGSRIRNINIRRSLVGSTLHSVERRNEVDELEEYGRGIRVPSPSNGN